MHRSNIVDFRAFASNKKNLTDDAQREQTETALQELLAANQRGEVSGLLFYAELRNGAGMGRCGRFQTDDSAAAVAAGQLSHRCFELLNDRY